MYSLTQKLTAEFLGVFALVFFGEGTVCAMQFLHGSLDVTLLAVALAHGLAVALMMSALGHISGGHFNPAITISFWVTKRLNTVDTLLHWVAQFAGAIAAAALLKVVIPEDTWRAVALGTPEMARDFPRLAAIGFEGVATFFLVLAFFATRNSRDEFSTGNSGFVVGLIYSLGILVCGPFTGGALNPARALGPALVSSHWANIGIFMIAPCVGAFVAVMLYDYLFSSDSVDSITPL